MTIGYIDTRSARTRCRPWCTPRSALYCRQEDAKSRTLLQPHRVVQAPMLQLPVHRCLMAQGTPIHVTTLLRRAGPLPIRRTNRTRRDKINSPMVGKNRPALKCKRLDICIYIRRLRPLHGAALLCIAAVNSSNNMALFTGANGKKLQKKLQEPLQWSHIQPAWKPKSSCFPARWPDKPPSRSEFTHGASSSCGWRCSHARYQKTNKQ